MSNNTFEVLAEGSEEGELLGMDFFKFTGLVPDAKVSIQDKNFNKTDYPSSVSLLACSGKYGYFVAGHVNGFIFGRTESLRTTVYATEKGATSPLTEKTIISLTLPVHQLRLSSDDLTVLAALSDGSLLAYSVFDLLEQNGNAQPKYTINLGTPIIDLRPNTEALPDSACVLLKDHQCRIINWKSGETIATIPGSDFSAICWSPKGKQVVCGCLDGTLKHYDLTGAKKDSLNPPESMQAGYGDEHVNRNVQDVLWIENHQFLVLYSRPTEPGSDEFINDGYIIDRKPKSGTGPKYTHLAEVTPIFSPEGRSNHFYMETIRSFGTHFPHVVILANGATNEVSVVGEDENGNWATWDLPENGMASLPLSEETNCDTFPLGLALDLSASEKLPPYDPSESDVGVEPLPVLLHLNDEGHIGSYHCYNDHLAGSGTKYQGMKTAITPSVSDIVTSESIPSTVTTQTTTAKTSAFDMKPTSSLSPSAFSSSPFGAAINSTSSGTSFASLTKIQGATTPSHGFGSLAQNKVANAVTPTFGSTTSFGATSGSSFPVSTTPAFGSTTSFGSMMKKDDVPAFGSTSVFGSTEKKTAAPAFGSSTEKKQGFSAFGSTTGFGAPSTAITTSTTLPFGPTGFGSTAATTAIEDNNDAATPKSGSTSSFEIVSKSDDTNLESDDKELISDTPVEREVDDLEKKNDATTTNVPSFESLAIGDQDKQQQQKEPPVESKKDTTTDQEQEGKVTGYKLGGINSDTDETDELSDDKDEPEKDVEPSKKETIADTTTPATTLSGFGNLAKNTIPGAMNPAFGQTTAFGSSAAASPATGGFGSLAKNTVPGAPASTFGSPSTLGSGGFSALSKNTVSGATAPAFGSPSTLGGGGFSALSKNTVSGATAPAFGSPSTLGGGGFSALSKNTVPGAKTPAFGSTSTLGDGSGFGSTTTATATGFDALAKKTVSGAMAPAFGSTSTLGGNGFGSTSFGEKPSETTTTTITPPTAKVESPKSTTFATSATMKPVVKAHVSAPNVPTTATTVTQPITQPTPLKYATPKEIKKEEPPAPKPVPKEEGMAKQFEALYFKITADLEKLSSVQGEFEKQLQNQTKQLTTVNKTVQNLRDDLKQWRLGECGQLGNLVEEISNELKKNDMVSDQKEQVAKMELKTSQLMNRKNQIAPCIERDDDPHTIAALAERELDDATREDCESLELRCKNTGELLGELEHRIINKTTQQRKPPSQTDTSNFSFYDFHRAIRDVERDLKRKDTEMKNLEQQLLLLKFKEHQRMAENSPSAITFEDLTDDEYTDAVSSQTSPERNSTIEGRFTDQHINYTVKYIQDEQIMDKLCILTSQRAPSNVNADASKK